jgi:hypothetical protein
MPKTPKELRELYLKLPEDLKYAIFSVDVAEALGAIGKKYNLLLDKVGLLADETGLVMLGVTHPREYISSLSQKLGVDSQTARKIAEDVNEQIFRKVRESLKKLHGITDEAGEIGETFKVEKPTTPPAPTYIPTPPTKPQVPPLPADSASVATSAKEAVSTKAGPPSFGRIPTPSPQIPFGQIPKAPITPKLGPIEIRPLGEKISPPLIPSEKGGEPKNLPPAEKPKTEELKEAKPQEQPKIQPQPQQRKFDPYREPLS